MVVNEQRPGQERFKGLLKRLTPDVSLADLGNPAITTTEYDGCLYDQTNALVATLEVDRAGQLCGTIPCWKATSNGFRYNDRQLAADGVQGIVARSGAGLSASMRLKAANKASKGFTAMPTGIAAALQAPNAQATLQLVTSDGGCFTATVTTVQKNSATQFKASLP